MPGEKLQCGEFLVIDLDDPKQVDQVELDPAKVNAQKKANYIAAKRDLPKQIPHLSIDNLIAKSKAYTDKHPGKKLAHTFPSNDNTSQSPPWEQYLEKGSGLAVPYQVKQTEHYSDKTQDPPIWVTPIPATFYKAENQDDKTQKAIIQHYIAGLYFQVGLGNGICVPVRDINGYSGSKMNAAKPEDAFDHPAKPKSASVLADGKEYAWGAGIDKKFCANHGAFLEDELNKLDSFMARLRNADSREEQDEIIEELDGSYQTAFMMALEDPTLEWYNAYGMNNPIKRDLFMDTGEDEQALPELPESPIEPKQSALLTDQLAQLLFVDPGKSSKFQAEELEQIKQLLDQLKTVEHNYDKLVKQPDADKSIAKTQFWLAAKKSVENLHKIDKGKKGKKGDKINKGYVFDTLFTEEDEGIRLEGINKLIFRTNTAQDRHITPIQLIMHLFREMLYKNMPLEDVRKAIMLQLESFKQYENKGIPKSRAEKADDIIQDIYDYYKSPGTVKTSEHINTLLKLVAHFYNTSSQLVLNDDYVKIPDKTFDRYLIPTVEFGGGKYKHAEEGSFITAQNKILTAYNWMLLLGTSKDKDVEKQFDEAFGPKAMNMAEKVRKNIKNRGIEIKEQSSSSDNKGHLKNSELKQIIYAVYAMFDYLPLPEKIEKNKNVKFDKEKHRYPKEPLERLYRYAAVHLQMIFLAHPMLENHYSKEITDGFLHYLTNGVSEKDLAALGFDKETREAIIETTNKDAEKSKKAKKGEEIRQVEASDFVNPGFANQYEADPEKFFEEMQSHVNEYLKQEDSIAELSDEDEESRDQNSVSSDEEENQIGEPKNLEDIAIRILLRYYHSLDGELENLPREVQTCLKIDADKFIELFDKKRRENNKALTESDWDVEEDDSNIFAILKETYQDYKKELSLKIELNPEELKKLLENAPDDDNELGFSQSLQEYLTSKGTTGSNTKPPSGTGASEFSAKKPPASSHVDDSVSIPTAADGNCAFNAIALGITDLALQDKLSEIGLKIDGGKRSDFYALLQKKLPLTEATQAAFKTWLDGKGKDEIQKTLALILREFAIDNINANYKDYKTAYEEQLFYAFNLFLKPAGGDVDDIFIVHPHIKEKFNALLVPTGKQILALEKEIKTPELIKSLKELQELLEGIDKKTAKPEALKKWWDKIFKELTDLKKLDIKNLAADKLLKLKELEKIDKIIEDEIKAQEKGLKEWWDPEGVSKYFSSLRQSARYANDKERWGGDVETGALANLLGINLVWKKHNQGTERLGPGKGLIPISELVDTQEMIAELRDRKIGDQYLDYFRLEYSGSLDTLLKPLTKEEFDLITKLIDNVANVDKPITELIKDDNNLYARLHQLGVLEKRGDEQLYFIKSKENGIDKARIIKNVTAIDDKLAAVVKNHAISDLPTFTITNNGAHWTYQRTGEVNKTLNGKFVEPVLKDKSSFAENFDETPIIKFITQLNCNFDNIAIVNQGFRLSIQNDQQIKLLSNYLIDNKIDFGVNDGCIIISFAARNKLAQLQQALEIAEGPTSMNQEKTIVGQIVDYIRSNNIKYEFSKSGVNNCTLLNLSAEQQEKLKQLLDKADIKFDGQDNLILLLDKDSTLKQALEAMNKKDMHKLYFDVTSEVTRLSGSFKEGVPLMNAFLQKTRGTYKAATIQTKCDNFLRDYHTFMDMKSDLNSALPKLRLLEEELQDLIKDVKDYCERTKIDLGNNSKPDISSKTSKSFITDSASTSDLPEDEEGDTDQTDVTPSPHI